MKVFVNLPQKKNHNVYIGQFFPPQPSVVGHFVQPDNCHIIEHIFEGNIEKIRFSMEWNQWNGDKC